MTKKPKVLLYDIETSPIEGYAWGKYQQNLLKISRESEILSVSYKWLEEPSIYNLNRNLMRDSEEKLVKKFYKVMDSADATIAHNGDEFDKKRLYSRYVKYVGVPPSPTMNIDTRKIAKQNFGFTSNSLDDLASYLGLGAKKKTGGIELWFDCMAGKREAWSKMTDYNDHDVVLLEKVYLKLRAWAPNHPNLALVIDRPGCPVCQAPTVTRQGYKVTRLMRKPRFQCQACGHWFYGKVAA